MIEKKDVLNAIEVLRLRYLLKTDNASKKVSRVLDELHKTIAEMDEERSTFCDIYVKDKYSGRVHRVGDGVHDSIRVDSEGTLHYYNLQNGDGCIGYKSINKETLGIKGRESEYKYGYEFVPSDIGEADPEDLSAERYKEKQEKNL